MTYGPFYSVRVPERTGEALRCLFGRVESVPVEAWAEAFHVTDPEMLGILQLGQDALLPNARTYVRPDLARAILAARQQGESVPSIASRLRCTPAQVYAVMEQRAVVTGATTPPSGASLGGSLERVRRAYVLTGFRAASLARIFRTTAEEIERALFGVPPYDVGTPVRPMAIPTREAAQGVRNLRSFVGGDLRVYAECFDLTLASMQAFFAGNLGPLDSTVFVSASGRTQKRAW